jgi:hypothetical protein
MRTSSFYFIFFSFIFLIPACNQQLPNTPLSVSQTFWQAALKGDTETAQKLLTPETRANFNMTVNNNNDFVEFGVQNLTTTHANIATTIIRHQHNQKKLTVLTTLLINQNGQWLIDFDQTQASIVQSGLHSILNQLSNTMQQTIDQGVKIMGESVKDELQQIENVLQENLQEINDEMKRQQQYQQQLYQQQQNQKHASPPLLDNK